MACFFLLLLSSAIIPLMTVVKLIRYRHYLILRRATSLATDVVQTSHMLDSRAYTKHMLRQVIYVRHIVLQ